MPDDARVPVAIRITRPFGSEDEFLQRELDTLTRTTVVLVGAQSRPQGVVLRFEVTLASGDPLLRGEGRVVGFRPAAQGNDSGLTLRFTRLDARSKALVDRAAALRDARARTSVHPRPIPEASGSRPVAPEPGSSSTAVNIATPSSGERPVAPPARRGPPPLPPAAKSAPTLTLDSEADLAATHVKEPGSGPDLGVTRVSEPDFSKTRANPVPVPIAAPPRREELLERLRQRAKALSPADVEALLASRPRKRA